MVYVSHYGYDRSTGNEVFFLILFFVCLDGFYHFGTYKLGLEPKFFCYEFDRFCIKTHIDRYHHINTHTSGDYLIYGYVHHVCQVAYCYKLCKFEDAAFSFSGFDSLFGSLTSCVATIFADACFLFKRCLFPL